MNLNPEAITTFCALSSAGTGIVAYGLFRYFRNHPQEVQPDMQPELTDVQREDLSQEGLAISKRVLVRRTEKSGPVAALNVLEKAAEAGGQMGTPYSFGDLSALIGAIAEAALPELDKRIDEKYPAIKSEDTSPNKSE